MNLTHKRIAEIRTLVSAGIQLGRTEAEDLLGHNDHLNELCEARARLVLRAESESETLRGLYQMHKQTETREMRDLKAELASLKTGYEAYERVNAELRAECEILKSQVKALQADPNSYQTGFDDGRKFSAAHADNWRQEAQASSSKVAELRAECEALRAQQIHWVTQPGNGLIRCVSDDRYQKFAPSIRARYEPIVVQENEYQRKDAQRYRHGYHDLVELVTVLKLENDLRKAECEALRKDKDRLDALEGNFWDVRHSSDSLADTGDYTSSVEVVGFWMDKPFERVIGENYNESLRAAIDQAMTADAYPPARPEYPELEAAMTKEPAQ